MGASNDTDVQRALCRNSRTPPEVLNQLANSHDVEVQIELAHNSATPAEVLKYRPMRGLLLSMIEAEGRVLYEQSSTGG